MKRQHSKRIAKKLDDARNQDIDWPNCGIPGCQNKSCRAIGSMWCSPHSELAQITKLLDENVVATHTGINNPLSILERIKWWLDAKQTLINTRDSRIEDLTKNRNTLQAKLEAAIKERDATRGCSFPPDVRIKELEAEVARLQEDLGEARKTIRSQLSLHTKLQEAEANATRFEKAAEIIQRQYDKLRIDLEAERDDFKAKWEVVRDFITHKDIAHATGIPTESLHVNLPKSVKEFYRKL